jgi:two-component system sensor histidine kinase TctE
VGSYARQLSKPLGTQGDAQRVVIQVAETLGSRQAFIRRLMLQSVQRDLLLIALATVLLTGAIGWALRPLRRLHDEVQARPPDDLAPVDASGIPADVRPLVEAINHHIQSNRRMSEARRRFIDDASHQLRTPLTTLTTQVAYALREPDGERMRDALGAVKLQLDETVRQTNQMLSLARTDAVELTLEPVDLVALATSITREWWPAARDNGIDLGLEAALDRLRVDGHKGLLREAMSNLLHNALRYTPRGGSVTVAVRASAGQALVEISDTGPGIPPDEMARAGERFFRASNVQLPGSGLGLAIVASIAQRHGGSMRLSAAAGGQGLAVTLVLPLPAGPGNP